MNKFLLAISFLLSGCYFSSAVAQEFSIGPEKKANEEELIEKVPAEKKDTTKVKLKDRIYFGGTVGAQFGNYTFVDFSPMIGLKVNKVVSFGAQSTFQYLSYNSQNYSSNIIGISGFTRVMVYRELFLQAEYGVVNGNFKLIDEQRETLENFLLGAGYNYILDQHFKMYGTVLFNVLQTPYHPYQNPLIRVGFSYGF
jgi:hypothetical protein